MVATSASSSLRAEKPGQDCAELTIWCSSAFRLDLSGQQLRTGTAATANTPFVEPNRLYLDVPEVLHDFS